MGIQARESLLPTPALLLRDWLKPGAREKSRPPAAHVPTRFISVIIPAHNEEHYLGETLESLRRQNYHWFETIVVANGCTDNTANVARSRCNRLIVLSQKSLGVARNLGARMARGELLLFLDADTVLDSHALRTVAQSFQPGHAAGTLRGWPDAGKLKYRLVYHAKNAVHRWRWHPGSSGVIVCWKSHFMREGGFDERLEVRENSELMRRLLRHGAYAYLGGATAVTSMRRYEHGGFGRTAWLWVSVWLQSFVGDLHHRRYEPVR